MSSKQLEGDRACVARLEEAVAAFKAALGGEEIEEIFVASLAVDAAMARCIQHAGRVRAEERKREGQGAP